MRFKKKSWKTFELPNIYFADRSTLEATVKSASTLANRRLRSLRDANKKKGVDYYTSFAYEYAMSGMERGRKTFKTSVTKMTDAELRREYVRLRDFLTSQTSTVGGVNHMYLNRYIDAQTHGYFGTLDEFMTDIEKTWTEENESFFSSDVLYSMVTGNSTDIIDVVTEEFQNRKKSRTRMNVRAKELLEERSKNEK